MCGADLRCIRTVRTCSSCSGRRWNRAPSSLPPPGTTATRTVALFIMMRTATLFAIEENGRSLCLDAGWGRHRHAAGFSIAACFRCNMTLFPVDPPDCGENHRESCASSRVMREPKIGPGIETGASVIAHGFRCFGYRHPTSLRQVLGRWDSLSLSVSLSLL